MPSPNSYASYVTGFTGAQITLPAGLYSWSVTAQSGLAYVNGFPLAPTQQIGGGRYGGFKMNGSTQIVVGCTGGSVIVTYDL